MLHVSFNQDSTCFVCGKENGFAVYNCDPPTERFHRLSQNEAEPNGIGVAEMLFRSNIFALVGGGQAPRYPRNALMIWDDFHGKCIANIEFLTPVTGVKLNRGLILVTIENKAYLYGFDKLQLLKSYDTFSNPQGIAALTISDITNSATENAVIAVPGNVLGSVIIDNHTHGKQHVITAHTNPISALALNSSGTRLATASERGTLIRIWDTRTGHQVREFRRGLEVVTITSLAFDRDTTRLVVCSDKGTAHVYSLMNGDPSNRRSSLYVPYISDYLPSYFNSEWSSVSFEVPPGSICTFSNNSIDTIYAITLNGKFYKYTYNTEDCTGECVESIDIDRLSSKN